MSGTKSAPWVGRLAHRVHPDGFALVGLVLVVVAAAVGQTLLFVGGLPRCEPAVFRLGGTQSNHTTVQKGVKS